MRYLDFRRESNRYLHARVVLEDLNRHYKAGHLTRQEFKTLRGQALAGDVEGAGRGLVTILRRAWA